VIKRNARPKFRV